MFNILNEKIILPLSDILQGYTISDRLDFLLKSQYWSGEEFIIYQEKRLQELISYVYHNVPYYKEWFRKSKLKPDDVKHLNDLHKLPIVSKSVIRQNPLLFRTEKFAKIKSLRMNSSGSTGEPFEYFLAPDSYSIRYAAALRGWYWMGYRLGDSYSKLSQNKRTSSIKKIQDIINRCMYIYIPDLSMGSLNSIIQKLEKEKPKFIRCYPDPLVLIAKILRMNNKFLYGTKAINCTGNILTMEARSIIEERFNCPVFDSYSCEGGSLFYQGPTRENYMGTSEIAITEILNNDGNDVSPGETGMHVTTDLWNYTMPFIRYNTQDLVVKSNKTSSCGRSLTGLDKIIGRDNDILVTPSGNLLIVHLFTIYFEYFNSVKQFQIEQLQPDEFVFRLVVEDTFKTNILNEIREYWQNFLGNGVKLTIEIHDIIPMLYSGKRRFLIRNSEIKLPY